LVDVLFVQVDIKLLLPNTPKKKMIIAWVEDVKKLAQQLAFNHKTVKITFFSVYLFAFFFSKKFLKNTRSNYIIFSRHLGLSSIREKLEILCLLQYINNIKQFLTCKGYVFFSHNI